MDEKQIIKPLMKYIESGGHDYIGTWNDWLIWICRNLEWSTVVASGGYANRFMEMRDDNPYYFEAMAGWLEYATEHLKQTNGAFDAFGAIYEAHFQSRAKAGNSGQFFTPMSLCLSVAALTAQELTEPTDNVLFCNDPACGSGRLPLASWSIADQYNRILFMAGDIDTSSVNMCTLNFMIAGMVGIVEKKDALTGRWYGAYLVNSGKIPYWNTCATLQWYSDEEKFNDAWSNLKAMAQEWDCIKYRKC